jgi:Ca-activated chloride channel homolog
MKRIAKVLIAMCLVVLVALSAACSSSGKMTSMTATQPAVSQTSVPGITYTTNAPAATGPATSYAAPTTSAPMYNTTATPSPYRPTPAYSTVPPSTTSAGAGGGGGSSFSNIPTIGLSTGGAKDISNFRENIKSNYLPLPSDVTYEGLFYDYYFDTGSSGPANKLFSPSYTSAVTCDPFSQQTEYYLAVGLNSGLKESDFQRKKLNLVILLDNSGSMNEQYNQYYYDGNGRRVDAYAEGGIMHKNKMDSGNESVVNILTQLNNDDWFSIITFNSQPSVVKQFGPVSQANISKVKDQVLNIAAGGSTNLDAGLDEATRQFNRLTNLNPDIFENRVIVLTDAQPNTGDIGSSNFLNTLANNANKRVFTTFIGIGVDFNSDLIEKISKIKGCNYYSVHSPNQFRQRIEDEFDYMVTPLVFNVELRFESVGWKIEKVFGSPQADESTSRLLRIDSLFAAKTDSNGQVKGGLVLLKLKKISSGNQSIYLRTTYEDRNGHNDSDTQIISLETISPEYFDNTGIRKGVLLTRYAALLKNWLIQERQNFNRSGWMPYVDDNHGIVLPADYQQWERHSLPLTIAPGYQRLFKHFNTYFAGEIRAIGDYELGQELDILDRLAR